MSPGPAVLMFAQSCPVAVRDQPRPRPKMRSVDVPGLHVMAAPVPMVSSWHIAHLDATVDCGQVKCSVLTFRARWLG